MLAFFLPLIVTLFVASPIPTIHAYTTEDIYVNGECSTPAQFGDHVLLEYSVMLANGSHGSVLKSPHQLFHTILKSELNHLPIISSIVGLCANETRRITWQFPSEIDLEPIFHESEDIEQGLQIDITVASVTTAVEYEIFNAINGRNLSLTLDYIDQHVGVNAVDEWGQTPLMIAIQLNQLDMIAALLNSRIPRVNVNQAKPSGYTALFYAVQKSPTSIIAGLLKRGANPNAVILQEGSRGNTPLHFACLLEKVKVIEMLIEHGANPMLLNQYGQSPLQVLPVETVRSTKLYLKKIFEDAVKKLAETEEVTRKEVSAQMLSARSDM